MSLPQNGWMNNLSPQNTSCKNENHFFADQNLQRWNSKNYLRKDNFVEHLKNKKQTKKQAKKKRIAGCVAEFCSFHEQVNFQISGNGVKNSSSKTLKNI